jgi:glycosyltransferase involved in cell wall biosynthesis
MACKRSVLITRTQGIVDYLVAPDIAKVVDVPDAAGLREAIVHLLKNPQEAESQAQQRTLCRCFSPEAAIALIKL